MEILDPGHIYKIQHPTTQECIILTFVKRGGGAIQYEKEWPGIQTQAVMRALIQHFELLEKDHKAVATYSLWQLGSDEPYYLTLRGNALLCEILDVLIDRSQYLNTILECTETGDACYWLGLVKSYLLGQEDMFTSSADTVRLALWNYEARAYRRKQEKVNRAEPSHDDTSRPRPWRMNPCDDIERRPISKDGHIVL